MVAMRSRSSRLPILESPNFYLETELRMLGVDPRVYEGRVLDIRKDVWKTAVPAPV